MTSDFIFVDATEAEYGIQRGVTLLNVHDPSVCVGQPCCIHHPSDHHMVMWRQNWRADRGIMERICPHGVGHPDPDDFSVRTGLDGGIHGCCGCCGLADPGGRVSSLREMMMDPSRKKEITMEEFEILSEHIALLRAMHWRWDNCEFGAPAVDSKRPFGFSSGYYRDMAEAVGQNYDEDDQEQEDQLGRLYRETMTVLMIALSSGSFEPGVYRREPGQTEWARVEAES